MYSGIKVQSPNIRYTQNYIESDYIYESVNCSIDNNNIINAIPVKSRITFRTDTNLPKLGVMLIGKFRKLFLFLNSKSYLPKFEQVGQVIMVRH